MNKTQIVGIHEAIVEIVGGGGGVGEEEDGYSYKLV